VNTIRHRWKKYLKQYVINLIRVLNDLTTVENQNGGFQTGTSTDTRISQLVVYIGAKFPRLHQYFQDPAIHATNGYIVYDPTGSGKFKIVTFKPEISQLVTLTFQLPVSK